MMVAICSFQVRRSIHAGLPAMVSFAGYPGTAMPLDPLAKRFLVMMAAAAPAERTRPSAGERRQSLARLMQFARAEADVTTRDGTLPGPGGEIAYRLYAPEKAGESVAGLCSSMAAAWSQAASKLMIGSRRRWLKPPAAG